jgi:hypothetical protein
LYLPCGIFSLIYFHNASLFIPIFRYIVLIPLTDPSQPDSTSRKPEATTSPKNETVFFGKGMIAVILGIVALILILLYAGTMGGSSSGMGTVIPAQKCADITVAYLNNNLVQPGTAVSLVSVTETKGLYQVTVKYQSREMPVYTTKDCTLLFTNSMNMNGASATPVPTREPKKTARPTVDLYVMAFCPFGTQAETVMRPVKDLLGSKADIRIRYITTITGTTLDTVQSLHGPSEAREDAYQVCLMKSQPEKYWEYVRLFNEQCYPKWQDSGSLAACRKNVTASLKIDSSAIETCAAGADAIALLKADETESDSNRASASPTLVINGVTYAGARTPDAYKQAICNSFETAPAECSTTLSSAATGTTGNC